mmetsp:Transcript_65021/g.156870  ORF Transcript_65021/g.156870 Transcript_65021/m.156870 type:complete len:203 (-) Transcript_65021:12-620(-)
MRRRPSGAAVHLHRRRLLCGVVARGDLSEVILRHSLVGAWLGGLYHHDGVRAADGEKLLERVHELACARAVDAVRVDEKLHQPLQRERRVGELVQQRVQSLQRLRVVLAMRLEVLRGGVVLGADLVDLGLDQRDHLRPRISALAGQSHLVQHLLQLGRDLIAGAGSAEGCQRLAVVGLTRHHGKGVGCANVSTAAESCLAVR